MQKQKKHTQPPLVVIDVKSNMYKRFVGKQRTDHVKAEYPMSMSMLEQFRTNPDSLFEDEDELA